MINKKFLLLTLTIVFIASLGVINATNITDDSCAVSTSDMDQTFQTDNTIQEQSQTITKNTQSSQKEATTTQVEDYTQLYNNLTDTEANEETTIMLGGDSDTYTITDTITLSSAIKNLTIEGNGKTIDGNGKYQFLNVNNTNIVIKNLTIFNTSNETGGAINANNTNLTLENVNFSSNYASISGSSIYYTSDYGNILKIKNSTFECNGKGVKQGELIREPQVTQQLTDGTDSTQSDDNQDDEAETEYTTINVTTYFGGAVYIVTNGESIIEDTVFYNNSALYSGIIYYRNDNQEGKLSIKNSTFEANGDETFNNTLDASVLTIENSYTTEIINSNFTKNYGELGTINANIPETGSMLIENSIIDSNLGNSTSGAITLINEGTLTLKNNTISNNTGYNAGAIDYLGFYESNLNVINNIFLNNSNNPYYVQSEYGGALNIETGGNVSVINNTFYSNIGAFGGAINYNNIYNESILIIKGNNFTSNGYNKGEAFSSSGGAINIEANNTILIDNNMFSQNLGYSNGGAINYIGYEESQLTINNSQFDSNGYKMWEYVQFGGALYIETSGIVTIDNSQFTNNFAYNNGAAIYYVGYHNQSILHVNNSKFDTNGLKSYYMTFYGGSISIESEANVSITNTEFTSNNAQHGGVIYYINNNENSSFIVDNSTFDSNGMEYKPAYGYYTAEGAAIFLKNGANTNITNSVFKNNHAEEGVICYISENENTTLNIINDTFESNGYQSYEMYTEIGAVYVSCYNNVSIINSTFNNNLGCEGGALYIDAKNLIIEDSIFEGNGKGSLIAGEMEGSGLYLMIQNNTTISNSKFINNRGEEGGAINYWGADENSTMTISGCLFDSNKGNYGGTLYLSNVNTYINHTNFTNNTLDMDTEKGYFEATGMVIYSEYNNLYINNTNFIANGFPSNITEYDLGEELELDGALIRKYKGNLTIDKTNFTDNYGGGYEGGIVYYYDGYTHYSDNCLNMNNTIFADNKILAGGEEGPESMGYVMYISGNANIDNSLFAYNKLIIYGDFEEIEESGINGIIYVSPGTSEINYYSTNVTNSVFISNDPANFIIKDNQIVLNYTYYEISDGEKWELMSDGYIPNFGDVTIYVDESEEGTQYNLKSINKTNYWGDVDIYTVYVDEFTVPENAYVIKMVVNQTEKSQFYDYQLFNNNTYYFILPHDYILNVNATTPVKVGDNTTITGKAYFTNSTDEEVVFANKQVDLYVNNTYITSTLTDEEGNYEFNYTCNVLGLQNITVALNQTINLPRIINNTEIEVLIRESIININVSKTNIGEESNITFTLIDTDGNPITDSSIYFYVDDTLANGTTDENGTLKYTCKIEYTGHNYVLAFYDGDYSHTSAINSTIFIVDKLNTTITVTATDTILNDETVISGKLVDQNNNAIKAPIIIYIDEDTIYNQTDENGEFSFNYPAKLSGENYVAVIYEGNDTYYDSINKTAFHVERINTTTTSKVTSTNVGNVTLEVSVTGKDGKTITNGTILIYDENDSIVGAHEITGEKTIITLNDLTNGIHTLNLTYTGNDTYNPSTSTQTVKVKARANVEISVNNDTEGNVEIEVTVTDENANPVSDQEVNITLPNGTTLTKKTDKYGKVKVTDTTTETGNATVQVTVATTEEINGTTANKTFTIDPDYQKIIDKMNDTIQEQNQTIEQQNQTIQDQDKVIDELNDTVQEQNQTIQEQNQTIQEQNQTIQEQNQTIQDQDKVIDELNDTVQEQNQTIQEQNQTISDLEYALDELNKTSDMTVVAENSTVDNTKVIVALSNEMGTPLSNAEVTVQNSNGETVATATTDDDGVAIIPVDTREGTEDLTVIYQGNENFTPVNKTITVTTVKNNVTVTVDPVNGIIGENITLTAHVTDVNGNPVSGGNLVFKLNGKTLRVDGRFDSSASAWKFSVKDGIVTITIQADLYLRNAKNLTASYSGTYKYNEAKSATVVAQIKKRNAQLTVTASPTKQKQYQTITFTAKLEDITPNYKNTTAINTNTQVIFKVNGKTLKDDKGNSVIVNITNAQATYKYTVAQGMGGINKDGSIRDYNVTALLVSDTYYPDTKNDTYFNVERSSTTINIEKTTVNTNNQLSIKATLTDYKGNNLIGTNDVNIKINGKTYTNPNTNKTQNFKVTDGVIDLSNLQINKNVKLKTVTIVTGARQAYLGQRNETTNIIRV